MIGGNIHHVYSFVAFSLKKKWVQIFCNLHTPRDLRGGSGIVLGTGEELILALSSRDLWDLPHAGRDISSALCDECLRDPAHRSCQAHF